MPSIPDASYASWLADVGRPSLATASPASVINLGLSSCSTPLPLQPLGRKRALLIGIRTCIGTNYSELPGAHRDVQEMFKLLLEVYAYTEDNITILLDDGAEEYLQPTRVNILAAIGTFVKDVRPGDQLFFHYCGHSMQVKNRSNTEEDGKDECLVPLDGEDNKIVDNELHRVLVKPLPAGACLVAILDTCHSGSLLDLKHYRCNRVFVPWKWRGKRSSSDIRNCNVRRDAAPWEAMALPPTDGVATAVSAGSRPQPQRRTRVFSMHSDTSTLPSSSRAPSPAPSSASRADTCHVQTFAEAGMILHDADAPPSCSISREQIGRMSLRSVTNEQDSPVSSRAPSPTRGGSPRGRLTLPRSRTRTSSLSLAAHGKENAAQLLMPKLIWILEEGRRRSDSPVPHFPCTGFCRDKVAAWDEDDVVKADVISLASCKDSQVAYEADGKSMTFHLVDLLRKNPSRTVEDVMITISHDMYAMALTRHTTAQEYKRNKKKYIANLTQRITRMELKPPTRRKSSLISDRPRATTSGTSSSRTRRNCKLASPLRKATALPVRKASDLVQTLKASLKEALQTKCEYDMDNFQNPELSSPRPLDMHSLWRM